MSSKLGLYLVGCSRPVTRAGAFALAAIVSAAGCAGKSTTYLVDNEGGASNSGGLSGSSGAGNHGGLAGIGGTSGGRGGSAGQSAGHGGNAGTNGSAGVPATGGGGSFGGGGFGGGGSGPVAGAGPIAGGGGVAGTGPIAGAGGVAGTTGMDPCNPNPCENGAVCAHSNGRYACTCPAGFEGTRCEVNVDECAVMPCLNGGECVDGTNAFSCDCLEGFEGPDCGVNHDDCSPNPCANGGLCSDRINGFTCTCPAGWEGELCDVAMTECSAGNVCQHGGTCAESDAGPRCICDRYTGATCGTPKVLLIHDGTPDLVASVLRAGDIEVTVAEIEHEYDATSSPPGEFCAVVHLNGTTYLSAMPLRGQEALRDYVLQTGGGFVGTAWNGYELAKMTAMSELILMPYVSGHEGPGSYQLTAAGSTHPVTAGLPPLFNFNAGFTQGRCASSSTALATEVGYEDAVCVAEVGTGRVVDFNHAGFYGFNVQYNTWEDPNVQRLLVQGVNWACGR